MTDQELLQTIERAAREGWTKLDLSLYFAPKNEKVQKISHGIIF